MKVKTSSILITLPIPLPNVNSIKQEYTTCFKEPPIMTKQPKVKSHPYWNHQSTLTTTSPITISIKLFNVWCLDEFITTLTSPFFFLVAWNDTWGGCGGGGQSGGGVWGGKGGGGEVLHRLIYMRCEKKYIRFEKKEKIKRCRGWIWIWGKI